MSVYRLTGRSRTDRRLRGFPLELLAGLVLSGLITLLALLGDALSPAGVRDGDLALRLLPPGTPGHWLGTDHLGRDLWGRLLEGLQWSLASALLANAFSAMIGVGLGLLAAQQPGFVRLAVTQLVSTTLSFPGLVAAVCVVAVFGQGFWTVVLTLSLITWPVFARVTYAEASSLLKRDYVLAAELAGVSRTTILWTHVLPALRPSLAVMLAFHFADMLVAESALSFLGLGAPVGEPTWGNMLADSRAYLLNASWMLFVPAGAIVFAVVAANLVGDGLATRDRLGA